MKAKLNIKLKHWSDSNIGYVISGCYLFHPRRRLIGKAGERVNVGYNSEQMHLGKDKLLRNLHHLKLAVKSSYWLLRAYFMDRVLFAFANGENQTYSGES